MSEKKKILVVDDSPTQLLAVVKTLEKLDYTLSTAVDGEEALEKALNEKPDLIILDIILPKKNGFQVCRQLKTTPDTQAIKVLLLSSKSLDADRFWGLKQGADEYMTKPFEGKDLVKTVAALL
jgi:twitching motility two-component system response regulator PilH